MLGTVVNTIAIIIGSLIGLVFRSGIPAKYSETVMHSISLAVILIGVMAALQTNDLLLVIISLAIGSVIGEFAAIEDRLQTMGRWFETKLSKSGSNISRGFVTATLVFCIGSMAVIGSMESGLTGNHQTLFAKALLDGISSIIFSASLGIGVMFSALSVFIYQGTLTLSASFMKQLLIPEVVVQMSSVGGLLIMAIGFNLLEIKKIKVGNMLPAIFVPLIYYMLRQVMPVF
ncbi:MAG: DUF554 domain-containing protein [Deltaproteobacteria bacterium]|nr:MAG: DUF554 domain-containing protein [Deltaproteobacteria bacterium]